MLQQAISTLLLVMIPSIIFQHSHGNPSSRRTMLRGVSCNANVPCPTGYTCMYSPFSVGAKQCFTNVNGDPAQKRPGRCPAAGGKSFMVRAATQIGTRCNSYRRGFCWFHIDCPTGQRCCPLGNGVSQCMAATAIDPQPQVTQLIEGRNRKHYGSSFLVQAAGKNILFDVGGYQTIETLKQALEKNGLTFEDVDFIVVSHGHTDHLSNLGQFPDTDHNYWNFIINGDSPKPNGLAKGQREFVLGNNDLELIHSPGHTAQDIAMVVRNVPGKGTVVLSADCVQNEADATAPTLGNGNSRGAEWDASRKTIMCQADWVGPGHGPLFQVTAAIKTYYKC